jgi:hypothetical protein
MDVLTLGIREVVGTPIEGVQGEQYNATIVYDENDRVVDLKPAKVASAMWRTREPE